MPLQGHIRRTSKKGGVAALKRNTKPALVKIGILRGAGEHNKGTNGQTVAEIGWWNEFGTRTIPPRPFLRPTLKSNSSNYRALMKRLIRGMLLGKVKPDKAQGAIGLLVQRDIQKTIRATTTPANVESTKKAKGSSHPLIDTGQLIQSISWEGWTE